MLNRKLGLLVAVFVAVVVLASCTNGLPEFDPDAPWTGSWLGTKTIDSIPGTARIEASLVQNATNTSGTVRIETSSSTENYEYDLTASVDAVVVTDNTIEGFLECVSFSANIYGTQYDSCTAGAIGTGAFQAQLTSDDTVVGEMPDFAARFPNQGFENITLRRR